MKTSIIICIAATLALIGCSAATDFDVETDTVDTETETEQDTETDTGEPYSLDDAVGNPVIVTLQKNGNAVISLSLDPAVPEIDGGDNAVKQALGDTIGLAVNNNSTSATVLLSDGTLVDGTPSNPGEFSVELSSDRQTLDVTFRNDFEGSSLSTDGDYTAIVSVSPNDFNFVIEEFTRDIKTKVE